MTQQKPDASSQPEPSPIEQSLRYAEDLSRLRASMQSLRRRMDEAGSPQSGKVLLVDDDPNARSLLSITLELERYEVLEAKTGTEALGLAEQHHPDLVLLDVRIPDVNGLEVCRRLKADPRLKDIPIVMVSALAMPADRSAGLEAGADRYITKPFSPLQLLEVIEGLLGKSAG